MIRLIVFVGAEERDVEIVARIFKVVRIAAEEANAFFRGKDEANVVEFLIAVKMIKTALIKRYDFAGQSGFRLAVFFEFLNAGVARFLFFFIGSGVGRRLFHLRGDVFNLV